MICILKMHGAEIKGWIIGRDIFDARDRAEAVGAHDLRDAMRSLTINDLDPGGRTELLDGRYIVLVQA